MTNLAAAPRAGASRRGMLLLLVLGMLTLFMMMGTLAIVMATRARETSLAYASVTGGAANRAVLAQQVVDEALLMLLRGTKDTSAQGLLGGRFYDNLLKDMYGTANDPFFNESYDAFDDANPFMTKLTLNADGLVSAAPRPAFAVDTNAAVAASVDNDGDGVADGIWLPKDVPGTPSDKRLFPSLTTDDGNLLEFRVSYLVLDLDSRINVNTHGRPAGDNPDPKLPAGPADVDPRPLVGETAAGLMLRGAGGSLTGWDDAQWLPSVATQRRRPPDLPQQPVDGRFGGSGVTKTYDLRLDLEASRPSLLASAQTQNPFTLGELERVLRQYDGDATALPPRLAAILGDRAERCRMRITTDSWETPGNREDLNWVAPNSGVNYEKDFHGKLLTRIRTRCPQVPVGDLTQWLANVVDFRDMDNANLNFGGGVSGAEPDKDGQGKIPEGWNAGFFLSYAHLLGVPKGTPNTVAAAIGAVPPAAPIPLVSLVREYPEILEAVIVPSPFKATMTADPRREPGRINVNTCETAVWKAMMGQDLDNPFASTPAKNVGEMLMKQGLVFRNPTAEIPDPFDVRLVNHSAANRMANVATVRSHVFAVWITLEITDKSGLGGPPTYHRLFAIVDRSIPAQYAEGQNTDVREIIRLRRFLN